MKAARVALWFGFSSVVLSSWAVAQGPCETISIANPYDDSLFDDFGYAVLIQGETALIGLPTDGNVPGQVFVFQRQPWGWQQTQTLEASDPKPKNKFGHSLALDGDTLA